MDRQKIVTFGEIMLRLTPPDYLRFNQTNLFRASYGGSEANVAVSLANYGLQSEFVTRLPDNRVADACIDDLRRYGVRTDAILRGGKRLGIYYMEEAAAMRSSHVVYDRADSAFDTLQPGMIDWDGIFRGASWFHWSGISAAVSAAEIVSIFVGWLSFRRRWVSCGRQPRRLASSEPLSFSFFSATMR